jgi:hypothetical protein
VGVATIGALERPDRALVAPGSPPAASRSEGRPGQLVPPGELTLAGLLEEAPDRQPPGAPDPFRPILAVVDWPVLDKAPSKDRSGRRADLGSWVVALPMDEQSAWREFVGIVQLHLLNLRTLVRCSKGVRTLFQMRP